MSSGYILDKAPKYNVIDTVNYNYLYEADYLPERASGTPVDETLMYNRCDPATTAPSIVGDYLKIPFDSGTLNTGFYNRLQTPFETKVHSTDGHLKCTMVFKMDDVNASNLYGYIRGSLENSETINFKCGLTGLSDTIVFTINFAHYSFNVDMTNDTTIIYELNSVGNYTITLNGVLVLSGTGIKTGDSLDINLGSFQNTTGSDIYIKQFDIVTKNGVIDEEGRNLLLSDSSLLSANGVATSFPVTNLTNTRVSKASVFTPINDSVVITADAMSGETMSYAKYVFNTISLIGHNINSDATITLSYGDSLSSLTDITLTWNKDELVYTHTSNLTARYVRISIDDVSLASLVIGELVMGQWKMFSQCFFWNVQFQMEYNSINHYTDYKAKWNYIKNSIKSVTNIDFKQITDATMLELYDLFEESNGSSIPILFYWDDRMAQIGTIYGHLEDKFKGKMVFINVNDVTNLKIQGQPYCKLIVDDV